MIKHARRIGYWFYVPLCGNVNAWNTVSKRYVTCKNCLRIIKSEQKTKMEGKGKKKMG